jgi:hypothetical protein
MGMGFAALLVCLAVSMTWRVCWASAPRQCLGADADADADAAVVLHLTVVPACSSACVWARLTAVCFQGL